MLLASSCYVDYKTLRKCSGLHKVLLLSVSYFQLSGNLYLKYSGIRFNQYVLEEHTY